MNILIAEDDPVARNLLQGTLAAWGHDPIVVEDGAAALALLSRDQGPSMALLDWEMPEMDGPSVCRHLRNGSAPAHPLYIILVTGRPEARDLAHGLESGADDYVVKPFQPIELRARIQAGTRLLELQRALQERERFKGALEMAGAVCHEFNQPLQVVRGWTELILDDLADDDPNAVALRTIGESVERLGELTRKLMGVTRYRSKAYMDGRSTIIDLSAAAPS